MYFGRMAPPSPVTKKIQVSAHYYSSTKVYDLILRIFRQYWGLLKVAFLLEEVNLSDY
jgi:hypothetical protein